MMTTATTATMAAATTATTATTATAAAATTTVVTAVTVQQAISLSVFATLLLIGLLILKELLVAYASEPHVVRSWKANLAKFYAAHLNIAIAPLFLIFALIVVTKVAAVL